MTTRPGPHIRGLNGHEMLGGRANSSGMTLITKPRHFWPWLNRPARRPRERDRAGAWLRNAMIALGGLAAAAVVVSFRAQYTMVLAFKHSPPIAYVQAGIPDAGALVFACLGIALALHGKRAVRPRVLNVACVGISIVMNALAASRGWTALAVWVMAPVIYALASDTLIGVIRAWTIARQNAMNEALADDAASPMALLGGVLLWLLRLALAPPSTLAGFRGWVVDEVSVAPGRKAVPHLPAAHLPALPITPVPSVRRPAPGVRPARKGPERTRPSKKAVLLDLYRQHEGYGDRARVSRIAAELAPQADLQAGTARTYLLDAVRAALPAGEGDAK